jgi:phosphocarrier protein
LGSFRIVTAHAGKTWADVAKANSARVFFYALRTEKVERPMAERTVTIGTATGLHSRPAAVFVAAAGKAGTPVTIALDGSTAVNAASILSVLSLGVKGGDAVTITADGPDASNILATLGDLLESDLDAA